MPSNKPRLYCALYARGGAPKMAGKEDQYHWALFVGPKSERQEDIGHKFHAKQFSDSTINEWRFEERATTMLPVEMILVRIIIGKVENYDKMKELLRMIPVRPETPGWNCVAWVREALEGLNDSSQILGTKQTEWSIVRDAAMQYCRSKVENHRFDGKGSGFDPGTVPTYDLTQKTETIT
ncbi:Hypothetical protein R9X50_00177300 [Acrodontium crateriforme]|uniref:Uncharacterized protein n=1 Tax=Acrodontium crateriforme TaxID=150365 RepID=A0AAQ3M152_9PEZI|nr:Hypothetical protein R9X50_00177300 [Acrodontium crateriforme]